MELIQVIKELNGKLEEIETQVKDIKTKFGMHEDNIKTSDEYIIKEKPDSLTF